MNPEASKYEKRGVSADKTDVHHAIKNLDKGLFPNAFCKIMPDLVAGDPDYVNVMHADTAGTKTSLAYMYWKETGDNSVWKGVVQDSIVMNLDDMACVGITDDIILSSTIGRNKNYINGEALAALISASTEFIDEMKEQGVQLHLSGGETADVGDIVRTLDVGYTAFARVPKKDIIDINIQGGDLIVAFASYGLAAWEKEYNGGMGSNGLTSARHDVFAPIYAQKYPESFDAYNMPSDLAYSGSLLLTDIEPESGIPAGKLVLSPTRTYLPLIKKIIAKHRRAIHGIIHCSGGAQTKVLKFVEQKKIVKNNMLPIPPLFKMIQKESGTDPKEMYKVFNMGHRLEIYTKPEVAEGMIALARELGIEAQIIGFVEESDKNELIIESELGRFTYA